MSSTDPSLRQERALSVARSAARRVGFGDSDAVVLKDSNHTIVHLPDLELVAKVAGSTTRGDDAETLLSRELNIARHLAARDAPITRPLEGDKAGPHVLDDSVVTLWHFYERDAKGSDEELGQALRSLHAGLADYDGRVPTFRDKLAQASAILCDPSRSAQLPDDDRDFLLGVGTAIYGQFDAKAPASQPLHGEPHGDNILWTSEGPLFLDFEGSIKGPQEWDIAYLPEGALSAFPDRDEELVALCRRATSFCVAAWCWADPDRAPELRAAAEYHLKALRSSGHGRAYL